MNARKQLIFWTASFIVLTLLFSSSLGGMILSLFFVTFLFPIVLGTTLVFNRLLVPRYLLQDRKWQFVIYFFYLLVISIYLEMLVMVLAFVILADYQFENLGSMAGDIYLLTVILYLIVFVNGFIEILTGFQNKAKQLNQIEEQKKLDQKEFVMIRSNRQNVNIEIEKLILIESLADYVKVHTENDVHLTKQKIGVLEKSLPERFVRIHRSFLVNADKVETFNKEGVTIAGKELNYGRKYKSEALDYLSSRATVESAMRH